MRDTLYYIHYTLLNCQSETTVVISLSKISKSLGWVRLLFPLPPSSFLLSFSLSPSFPLSLVLSFSQIFLFLIWVLFAVTHSSFLSKFPKPLQSKLGPLFSSVEVLYKSHVPHPLPFLSLSLFLSFDMFHVFTECPFLRNPEYISHSLVDDVTFHET